MSRRAELSGAPRPEALALRGAFSCLPGIATLFTMTHPPRYFTDGLRVIDERGTLLCTAVDEATAQRIAEALTHLAGCEYESAPMSDDDWDELQRSLEEFVVQYDAEHPDRDPDALAKALGMR